MRRRAQRIRRRQEKEISRKTAVRKLRLPGKLADCTTPPRMALRFSSSRATPPAARPSRRACRRCCRCAARSPTSPRRARTGSPRTSSFRIQRGVTVMQKGLKSAVVSAIFLIPFAYPRSALSWNWNALSYQEAAWMCGTGSLQACEVMYAYEMARSGAAGGSQVSGGGGSPADSTIPQDHTISASPDNGDFGGAATTRM